jgi:hypothetical protein
MLPPVSGLQPSFLRDPVTWSQDELVAQYRMLAARYRCMATVEDRPLARDGLLELARQCDAAARNNKSSHSPSLSECPSVNRTNP